MAIAAWLVWKPAGFKAAAIAAHVVRCPAPLECHLVLDLLRHAPARLGVRGDRDPVAGDRDDDVIVLPLRISPAGCWCLIWPGLASHGIELLHLAIECNMNSEADVLAGEWSSAVARQRVLVNQATFMPD